MKQKLKLIICAIIALILLAGCSETFSINPSATQTTVTFTDDEREAIQALSIIKNRVSSNEKIYLHELYCHRETDEEVLKLLASAGVDSPLRFLVKYSTDSHANEMTAVIVHKNGQYQFQMQSEEDGESLTSIVFNAALSESYSLDTGKIENAIN